MSINLFSRETNAAAETTKASNAVELAAGVHSYQAVGTAATTGTAVVDIQGSNDGANWVSLGVISLSLINGTVTDGFTTFAGWKWTRANVSTLSTGSVKVWVT